MTWKTCTLILYAPFYYLILFATCLHLFSFLFALTTGISSTSIASNPTTIFLPYSLQCSILLMNYFDSVLIIIQYLPIWLCFIITSDTVYTFLLIIAFLVSLLSNITASLSSHSTSIRNTLCVWTSLFPFISKFTCLHYLGLELGYKYF